METIGIIGAMPTELADIREFFKDHVVKTYAGYNFHVCTYKGKLIVTACCGVAKVNSAQCAQLMIDKFYVDAIINTGVSGGMDSDVKVMDIVVSSDVCSHDIDFYFLDNFPPFKSVYECDQKLIDTVCDVCKEKDISHHVGRIVSGEAFISDDETKQSICERLSPLAVDMESAAVGQVAYRNNVPFVSVRCISDNADDDGKMSFEEFEDAAAKKVAEIVIAAAENL